MRFTCPALLAILIGVATLSGCSSDRKNNVEADPTINPLMPKSSGFRFRAKPPEDRSVRIKSITGLKVEATSTGTIILADGLAERQGAYNAQFRTMRPADEDDDGKVLALEFVVTYPETATPVGSERTREVRVAYSASARSLEDVSVIKLVGEDNELEIHP